MNALQTYADRLASGDATGLAAFVVALLGGLIAGFGPCVLPMVPAVFGYVTGRVADPPSGARAPWRRGIALSAAFVVGMSVVFAGIGAVAGALGRALLVGAWAYYVVAMVCVTLGLHLLGVVRLPFDALNRWLPQRRPERTGVVGAVLFGMLFGMVASPCSTPILAAIATLAAARGSVVEGAALLFVYGIGKGVPLVALGLASGSLGRFSSFARASAVLSRIGGAALIGAAGYLVWLA